MYEYSMGVCYTNNYYQIVRISGDFHRPLKWLLDSEQRRTLNLSPRLKESPKQGFRIVLRLTKEVRNHNV